LAACEAERALAQLVGVEGRGERGGRLDHLRRNGSRRRERGWWGVAARRWEPTLNRKQTRDTKSQFASVQWRECLLVDEYISFRQALSQHANRKLKRLVLALVIVFRTEIVDLGLRLV
jgi:hypothetical protein